MRLTDIILQQPSYGWEDENGHHVKPSAKQLFKEFFSRINILRSKKNWLSFTGWMVVLALVPFFLLFIFKFFSWWLLLAGFLYSMVGMGSHGTVWYHRYSTHAAFRFRNSFWRFCTQHLVIKVVPEEVYVISHHVHHAKSDQPGDPYNASAGWLYCFLADVNHQTLAQNMSEANYTQAAALLKNTGVKTNTYAQYKKWGSVSGPFRTIAGILANWIFWYGAFYLIGGNALACTLFGSALIWTVGIRTFNFEGHGKGKDKRKKGMDFDFGNMSINQFWPGFVAGEWHNNHHLFPGSARSGFLPYQIDFAWYYIYILHKLGGISEYHQSKQQFYKKYYTPYRIHKTESKL